VGAHIAVEKCGTSVERLRLSPINMVLVGAFLLGALVAGGLGNRSGAALLGIVGLTGAGCALYARRPGSRDITRINALEFRDERDRTLARSGFAVVGAAAVLLVLVEFIVVMSLGIRGSLFWAAWAQLMILCAVWGTANSVVVRRG
jgi:hypothetical protein